MTTLKTLRKLAARAIRVAPMVAELSPVLAVFRAIVVPLGEQYVELYDEWKLRERQQVVRLAAAATARQQMIQGAREWISVLKCRLPEVRMGGLLAPIEVPDDALAACQLLLACVQHNRDKLAFAGQIEQTMTSLIAATERALAAAMDAKRSCEDTRLALRQLARALDAELVGYREGLRVVLGRGSPEYQALRIRRSGDRGPSELELPEVETETGLAEDDSRNRPVTANHEPAQTVPTIDESSPSRPTELVWDRWTVTAGAEEIGAMLVPALGRHRPGSAGPVRQVLLGDRAVRSRGSGSHSAVAGARRVRYRSGGGSR